MVLDPKPVASPRLKGLLGKALVDEVLRDRLLAHPEAVAREFDLSPPETEAVKRLDRRTIQQAVTRLRQG